MSVKTAIQPLLDTAIGFIYPNNCQICLNSRATISKGFVCAQCWRAVRFVVRPFCDRCGLPFAGEITDEFECSNCKEMDLYFRYARSPVLAKGVVLDIIHRYKYRNAVWFEPFLSDLLIRNAAPVLMEHHCDMIVPVPLHHSKERERGFNQARNLSLRLGDACGIPVCDNLLIRKKATATQTKLSRSKRADNVMNAFGLLKKGISLPGSKIVLVDDVFTTGATTNACAKVLRAAGASDVSVWTVARGV